MLQYAGPQERASSISNDDFYRVEAASRPSLQSSAPQLEDRQQFSTATSQMGYGSYEEPDYLIATSQDSYAQFEPITTSTATLQARYTELQLSSSSTGASQISYRPNEVVPGPLHPSTVRGGDIDRPTGNRRQRTRRAQPPPVPTRHWYCCRCHFGPYNPALYADCLLNCRHKRCIRCADEYIQAHDFEAPSTSAPAMF
jgi:hypothetical protein